MGRATSPGVLPVLRCVDTHELDNVLNLSLQEMIEWSLYHAVTLGVKSKPIHGVTVECMTLYTLADSLSKYLGRSYIYIGVLFPVVCEFYISYNVIET